MILLKSIKTSQLILSTFSSLRKSFYISPKRAIILAQKMKFSIKDFFSKCDQIRKKSADLVTFTEKIFNRKLYFLFILGVIADAYRFTAF